MVRSKKKFDPEVIAVELMNADTAEEVTSILGAYDEFSDADNWHYLDDRGSNFNTIGNQAGDSAKATTELLMNMVDAVLLKRAYQAGIDPKDKMNSPSNLRDGVEQLIGLTDGYISTMIEEGTEEKQTKFEPVYEKVGETLVLAAAKTDAGLALTFVDSGEGQHGENFHETFLSLSSGRKSDIRFVQGKFNMGSTAVLRFSGNYYKLIVSRKYDESGDWAFTLMRRSPAEHEMPVVEYFAIGKDKQVPSFDAPAIFPLFNRHIGKSGTKMDLVSLTHGTVVKLYDYPPNKFRGRGAIRSQIHLNMSDTVLPFMLLEQEKKPQQGTYLQYGWDMRFVSGFENAAFNTYDADITELVTGKRHQPKIPIADYFDKEIGKVSIHAIVLRQDPPKWITKESVRIFHSVNGQVHYKEGRGVFSRRFKLPNLMDTLLVFVDASEITSNAHNEIWKADRENIAEGRIALKYLDRFVQEFRDSENVKRIAELIRDRQLKEVDQVQSSQLFEKLLKADRGFASLLTGKEIRIPGPSKGKNTKDGPKKSGQDDIDLKRNPTFFEYEEKFSKQSEIELPLDRRRPIGFIHDAETDFFSREKHRGVLSLTGKDAEVFDISHHMMPGRMTIFVSCPNNVEIGDTFELGFSISSPEMVEPLSVPNKKIKITPTPTKPKPDDEDDEDAKKKKHKKSDVGKDKGSGKDDVVYAAPDIVIYSNDISEMEGFDVKPRPKDMDEHSGGRIEAIGEDEYKFGINLDNVYLQQALRTKRSDPHRKALYRKYIYGMVVSMMAFKKTFDSVEVEQFAELQNEINQAISDAAGSVVATLTDSVPDLVQKLEVEDAVD
ncbi:MAG: hypothetical protein JJ973_00805 [Rhodospirillales bacterium]|nr:hypothetical protein [Rhodospirillales bacterium]